MTTTVHVSSVDERLVEAVKARAAATHRTLSAYIVDLIEHDLTADQARLRMRRLLSEIQADPRPLLDRRATSAALHEVRRDMGTA